MSEAGTVLDVSVEEYSHKINIHEVPTKTVYVIVPTKSVTILIGEVCRTRMGRFGRTEGG
jgi:hypothetical protein